MAKKNYSTDGTAIKLSKVAAILATPWTNASGTWVKGDDTYRFDNVLKDSTSITQDDAETNNIENEVSDAPILTNTTLGNWNFASTIEDVQKTLLKEFCGYTLGVDTNVTKVYAPSSYKEVYAEIAVLLKNGSQYVAFILPKVQLNSKMLLESLSSNMAGFSLAGIAQNTTVDNNETPFYIDTNYTMPTSFAGIGA